MCARIAADAAPRAASVTDELPGMTKKAFGRWHEGTLGVPAGDREWAKADANEDGFVIIDACAQIVLSGTSPLQPVPESFRTADFVQIFGSAVPKCARLCRTAS